MKLAKAFYVAILLLVLLGSAAQAGAPAAGSLALPAGRILHAQPPHPSGVLRQSSRWDPNGSDYDVYVWDNFTLAAPASIAEIRWQGGYDPTRFGSGGPPVAFQVAIYASIPAGTQPDVVSPPLAEYLVAGKAGEVRLGTLGGITEYGYRFVLPTPFAAQADVKYWLQIEALQGNIPDWGLFAGTSGDNSHFRRIANAGDVFYQIVPGDTAFTLFGPGFPVSLPLVMK
jgi:hypothetical protein